MSKGNNRKSNAGISSKEIELYNRARREKKALTFARGFPVVVELPDDHLPRRSQPQRSYPGASAETSLPCITVDVAELENGSLLDPVSDLLHMVGALDLYAAQCSDDLSKMEHCREDCTHELESKSSCSAEAIDDSKVLAIGRKLQLISEERRNIKNRFEIVKLIKRAFESKAGREAMRFLAGVLADENRLRTEQKARVYIPRTDILDDLYDHPLPKYIPLLPEPPGPEDLDDTEGIYDEIEPYPPELLERLLSEMPDCAAAEPFIDEVAGQEHNP